MVQHPLRQQKYHNEFVWKHYRRRPGTVQKVHQNSILQRFSHHSQTAKTKTLEKSDQAEIIKWRSAAYNYAPLPDNFAPLPDNDLTGNLPRAPQTTHHPEKTSTGRPESPETTKPNPGLSTTPIYSSSANPSASGSRHSSTPTDAGLERKEYGANSGVIHAVGLDTDTQGTIVSHRELTNTTRDKMEGIGPGGAPLISDQILFGAVFGIVFLLLVLAAVIVYRCRNKVKG